MNAKRKIEIFSAGCPVCLQAVELVKDIACESCEVNILEMHNADIAKRADGLGIKSVPAVVIDGKIAQCCAGRGLDEKTLRAAGIGSAA